MKVEKEKVMIEVKCKYANFQSKAKSDYFIYTDIEVLGHADANDMNHTTGIKVCAGVSACCYGIRRLLNDDQFNVEIRKGYFHVWTNHKYDLKQTLDRESVYALNTLVCQLYEIYNEYHGAFKSFDLIDVKESYDNYERIRKSSEQQPSGYVPRRKRKGKRLGLYSLNESPYPEEN